MKIASRKTTSAPAFSLIAAAKIASRSREPLTASGWSFRPSARAASWNHEAGEIAARPCQTRDEARSDGVATDPYDRDRARRLLRREDRRRAPGDDNVDLPTDKVGKEGGMLLQHARHPVLDDDVLSFDVSVVAQTLPDWLRVIDRRSVGDG